MIDPKLNALLKAVSKNEENDLKEQVMKLFEEGGELAQASLAYQNAPSCKHKGHTLTDVKEEAVDAIIVLISILHALGAEEDEVTTMLLNKTTKWYSKQDQVAVIDALFADLD